MTSSEDDDDSESMEFQLPAKKKYAATAVAKTEKSVSIKQKSCSESIKQMVG